MRSYILSAFLFSVSLAIFTSLKADGWVVPAMTNNRICPSSDGGFWAVTSVQEDTFQYSRYGILMAKYNTSGEKVFEKTIFSDSSDISWQGLEIIECPDNSGVLIEYSKSQLGFSFPCFCLSWGLIGTVWAKFDLLGHRLSPEVEIQNHDYFFAEDKQVVFYELVNPVVLNVTSDSTRNMGFYSDRITYDYNLNPTGTYSDYFVASIAFNAQLYDVGNVYTFRTDFYSSLVKKDSVYYAAFYTEKYKRDSNQPYGYYDLFLTKLDSNFKYLYVKKIDETRGISDPRIFVDQDAIYVNAVITSGGVRNMDTIRTISKIYKTTLDADVIMVSEPDTLPMNVYNSNYGIFRKKDTVIEMTFLPFTSYNDNIFKKEDGIIYYISPSTLSFVKKTPRFKKIRNCDPGNASTFQNNSSTIAEFTNTAHIFLKDRSIVCLLDYDGRNGTQGFIAWAKIDTNGICTETNIHGIVYGDRNANCNSDSSDAPLRNYTVMATSTADTFYTASDTAGNYRMYIDSGLYEVSLIPDADYPLWNTNACTPVKHVYLVNTDSSTANFYLSAKVDCPNLTTEIHTPFLRRCFSNTYKADYCNNGTIDAMNAYIDVTLDEYLQYTSSSLPATALGGHRYRFNLGTVPMGACGSFNIEVFLSCDSTFPGQTHCVESHIFPDTTCVFPVYNGPVIHASAACKDSVVEFTLKNTGGDMQAANRYNIMQDQVIRITDTFFLMHDEKIIIPVRTENNSTYRIEAKQTDSFPPALGNNYAAAFMEGCTLDHQDSVITGIINNFPLGSDPYRAIDCHESRGSLDPNEKSANPKGVDAPHYITKETTLEYTVLFQNTGNDTSHYIRVEDTISPYLDMNTFRIINTSHPYRFWIYDSNTVNFIFDNNISLVDSATNEPGSHGFVIFDIHPKSNLPVGTRIENTASIYFDNNPEVQTNTVFHTIGENYLHIDLINTVVSDKYPYVELSVFPNPFRDKATLQIKNVILKEPHLILLDMSGRIVTKYSSFTSGQIIIYRGDLTPGLYIFKITDGTMEVATGKISVQ